MRRNARIHRISESIESLRHLDEIEQQAEEVIEQLHALLEELEEVSSDGDREEVALLMDIGDEHTALVHDIRELLWNARKRIEHS